MTQNSGNNDPWGLRDLTDMVKDMFRDNDDQNNADTRNDTMFGMNGRIDLGHLTVKTWRSLEGRMTGLFGMNDIEVAETRLLKVTDKGRQIPVRLYRGLDAGSDAPLIVYFHGGGFVAGSVDSHDSLTRCLANESRAVVLSVDYRLAPEHPWPAALEDGMVVALKARHKAQIYGCNPERLILAGDSAGGTIATSLARLMAETGKAPAGQLLFYPATDLTRTRLFKNGTENSGSLVKSLASLERRGIDVFRQIMTGPDGGLDGLADPTLSPLLAPDLSKLPPSYIMTAGRDPLKAEIDDYITALKQAGIPVISKNWSSQPHGFLAYGRIMKDAQAAIRHAGQWVSQIII